MAGPVARCQASRARASLRRPQQQGREGGEIEVALRVEQLDAVPAGARCARTAPCRWSPGRPGAAPGAARGTAPAPGAPGGRGTRPGRGHAAPGGRRRASPGRRSHRAKPSSRPRPSSSGDIPEPPAPGDQLRDAGSVSRQDVTSDHGGRTPKTGQDEGDDRAGPARRRTGGASPHSASPARSTPAGTSAPSRARSSRRSRSELSSATAAWRAPPLRAAAGASSQAARRSLPLRVRAVQRS